MPTFPPGLSRDNVIEFIADSFEKDPRLAIEDGKCRYRAPSGAQCAFGRCITDDELAQFDGDGIGGQVGYEGINASDVLWGLPVEVRGGFYEVAGEGFWNDVQKIHDAVAIDGEVSGVDSTQLPELYRRWRDAGYPSLLDYDFKETLRVVNEN